MARSTTIQYFRRVLPYLRPYWHLAVVVVALIIFMSLATLLGPWPLKFLVDYVVGNEPWPPILEQLFGVGEHRQYWLLFTVVTAGALIALLSETLTLANEYVQTKLDQQMVLDFRSDLFEHAQKLSMAYHDQRRSGLLIYAINFQGSAVGGVIMAIPALAQSILVLIGMFCIVAMIDLGLAVLSLTVVPVLALSIRYYINHIQQRLYDARMLEAESLSIVHEAVSMMRVIAAFGREQFEHDQFRRQARRAINARIDVTVRQATFNLVVGMTTALGTGSVIWYGAHKVIQQQVTVGDLLVVLAYIVAVYKPLESISYTIGGLQEHFVSLRMAFDVYDVMPEVDDRPGAQPIARSPGHIRFEGVHFSYGGRVNTLQAITVDIQPGRSVAIVGPTGAGKTTLMSLLPRFYDVNEGCIKLDGVDVRDCTLKSLREQISIVLQEPLLFSGSIADNIRYGRLDASDAELMASARAANAHEFIMNLPEQYDTEVGERGAKLSGGERQRICIARSFLKDAPILIMDEPTSAVDTKTESVILDALDRLMVGRTSFLIAHRLSTIRSADLILVLDNGRLVQQGTHEELIRQTGLYRQLNEMQVSSLTTGPTSSPSEFQ